MSLQIRSAQGEMLIASFLLAADKNIENIFRMNLYDCFSLALILTVGFHLPMLQESILII